MDRCTGCLSWGLPGTPQNCVSTPSTKKTILLSFNPVLVEYSDLLNDIRVALGQKIDPKFDAPPLIDSPFAKWAADLHRVAQKITAYSENRLSEQEKKKS